MTLNLNKTNDFTQLQIVQDYFEFHSSRLIELNYASNKIIIPYRTYNFNSHKYVEDQHNLNESEIMIIKGMLSRYHDGLIRQSSLLYILEHLERANLSIVFIFLSLGDYVSEILNLLQNKLTLLNYEMLFDLSLSNIDFYMRLEDRMFSYREKNIPFSQDVRCEIINNIRRCDKNNQLPKSKIDRFFQSQN